MTRFAMKKSAVLAAAGAVLASGTLMVPTAEAYPINDPQITTDNVAYKKKQKVKIHVSNMKQGRKVRIRYTRIRHCNGNQIPFASYKSRYLKSKAANSNGNVNKRIKGQKKANMKKGIWRITAQSLTTDGRWVKYQSSTRIRNRC